MAFDIKITACKSGVSPSSITAMCSKWTVNDWKHELSLIVDSTTKRNALRDYITPGAVDKMYDILGTPVYWDTTFASGNTIKIEPLNVSQSTLYSVRPSSNSIPIPLYLGASSFSDELLTTDGYWLIKLSGYKVELV